VVGPHQRYLRIEGCNNLRSLADVDKMMIMMMLLDLWPLGWKGLLRSNIQNIIYGIVRYSTYLRLWRTRPRGFNMLNIRIR
jgi:hypothetical protein